MNFGINGNSARDLNRLELCPVKPLYDPDAHGAIFSDTCELVPGHVAELDKPDLITMRFQGRNTVLRDHICRAHMVRN